MTGGGCLSKCPVVCPPSTRRLWPTSAGEIQKKNHQLACAHTKQSPHRGFTSTGAYETDEKSGILKIKLDALRQWQCLGVVDGVGLTAHVRLPGIGAGFAAAAGFFFTTKCAANFCTGSTDVYIGNTAI